MALFPTWVSVRNVQKRKRHSKTFQWQLAYFILSYKICVCMCVRARADTIVLVNMCLYICVCMSVYCRGGVPCVCIHVRVTV